MMSFWVFLLVRVWVMLEYDGDLLSVPMQKIYTSIDPTCPSWLNGNHHELQLLFDRSDCHG